MIIESYGSTYDVACELDKYIDGSLAVQLIDKADGCPFARLTVNLGMNIPENYAFIDTNNFPDAEKLIRDYDLGTNTGKYGSSGYCKYPLYEMNMLELNKHLYTNSEV